jgi:hypothetical protein
MYELEAICQSSFESFNVLFAKHSLTQMHGIWRLCVCVSHVAFGVPKFCDAVLSYSLFHNTSTDAIYATKFKTRLSSLAFLEAFTILATQHRYRVVNTYVSSSRGPGFVSLP